MKRDMKKTAAAAALMIMMSGSQPVFAGAFNPYADVTAGNWSYEGMAKLIHAGYVSGVDDVSFSTTGVISRKHMAELVARAMSKREVMDSAEQKLVDKFIKEYSKELKLLGVEDEKLGNVGSFAQSNMSPTEAAASSAEPKAGEKKVKSRSNQWYDNFEISGKAFLRYERANSKGISFYNAASHGKIDYPRYMQNKFKQELVGFDLRTKYKFNDSGWFFATKSEFNINFNNSGRFNQIDNKHFYYDQCQDLNKTLFEEAYLEGPLTKKKDLTIRTGRYNVYTPQGLVMDGSTTGSRLDYTNKGLHVAVDVGRATQNPDEDHTFGETLFCLKDNNTGAYLGDYRKWESPEMQNVMVDAQIGHNTKLYTSFTRVGGNVWHGQNPDRAEFISIGADAKLSNRWKLSLGAAHSNTGALTVYHPASWPNDGTQPFAPEHGGQSSGDWSKDNTAIKSSDHNAWMARLTYGPGMDVKHKGSFDIYALYRHQPRLVSYDDTDGWYCNTQGYRLGALYSFGHNIGLNAWYTWAKDIDTKVQLNSGRMELQFSF